jgi:hypothetical protein
MPTHAVLFFFASVWCASVIDGHETLYAMRLSPIPSSIDLLVARQESCPSGYLLCSTGGCCPVGSACTEQDGDQLCSGSCVDPIPCGPVGCCNGDQTCVLEGSQYRCENGAPAPLPTSPTSLLSTASSPVATETELSSPTTALVTSSSQTTSAPQTSTQLVTSTPSTTPAPSSLTTTATPTPNSSVAVQQNSTFTGESTTTSSTFSSTNAHTSSASSKGFPNFLSLYGVIVGMMWLVLCGH